MKLLVYGNCQANPLASLLGIANESIEAVRCPAVHTLKPERADQVRGWIAGVDVVVHQPIGEAFGPISSDTLKAEFPDKTWISFPSMYFGGLVPQLFYLRRSGQPTLPGPLADYHDRRIVESFLAGASVAEAVAAVEAPGDYAADYQESWDNTSAREAALDVRVMPVVAERIADERPFYTFNHPTNAILWAAAMQVLDHLGLKPAPGAVPPQRDFLSELEAMVPGSVLETCGARWTSPGYVQGDQPLDNAELVEAFYRAYEAEPELEAIYQRNLKRFGRSTLQIGG